MRRTIYADIFGYLLLLHLARVIRLRSVWRAWLLSLALDVFMLGIHRYIKHKAKRKVYDDLLATLKRTAPPLAPTPQQERP